LQVFCNATNDCIVYSVKLALFAAVMGFAAWNKLRFTLVLLRGENGAALKLRQSVRLEVVRFGSILNVVATITTLSAPETPDQTAVVMAS
jgi:putative copper export protein